jgi:hypothetical protein
VTAPDPATLTLAYGSHDTREDGVCLLEAVAWFAGEPHSDHPACVSPVLASYGRSLNDLLPDGKRQQLRPYIPLMPGTSGDGRDEARGYLALDWLIRTYAPAWLDLAGLDGEARALRGLRRIADLAAVQSVRPIVLAVRDKSAVAGDAAWAAAGDAARDAAGDAAWAAAGTAAWDAAWAAAWAAAGTAAAAAKPVIAEYQAAASAALAPTVSSLQDSAVLLFSRMITGES